MERPFTVLAILPPFSQNTIYHSLRLLPTFSSRQLPVTGIEPVTHLWKRRVMSLHQTGFRIRSVCCLLPTLYCLLPNHFSFPARDRTWVSDSDCLRGVHATSRKADGVTDARNAPPDGRLAHAENMGKMREIKKPRGLCGRRGFRGSHVKARHPGPARGWPCCWPCCWVNPCARPFVPVVPRPCPPALSAGAKFSGLIVVNFMSYSV